MTTIVRANVPTKTVQHQGSIARGPSAADKRRSQPVDARKHENPRVVDPAAPPVTRKADPNAQ